MQKKSISPDAVSALRESAVNKKALCLARLTGKLKYLPLSTGGVFLRQDLPLRRMCRFHFPGNLLKLRRRGGGDRAAKCLKEAKQTR